MEFKVGDRVRYIGMIHDSFLKNKLGEVKEKNNSLYNLVRFYLGNDDTIDMYMADRDLELIEENKKITLEQLEQRIEKLEKCVMGEQNSLEKRENEPIYERNERFAKILKKELERNAIIFNEPKPSLLTEDERVILRNVDKKYKYIARDSIGYLFVHSSKPKKEYEIWCCSDGGDNFLVFGHLFQFIKWTDNEPYNIEELLKEESEE